MDNTKHVEVGVVARNQAGQAEILVCSVPAPAPGGPGGGQHLDRACQQVQAMGYQTIAAFDSSEPAFAVIADGRKYKAFFDDATEALQDAIVPDRECSGADMLSEIDQLFGRHNAQEQVYIAFSADGYWSNADGWSAEARWATLFRDRAPLQALQNSGALSIITLALDRLQDVAALPTLEDLEAAADAALARARKHQFPIDEANAAEVMSEELALAGASPVAAATPMLRSFLLHTQAKEAESQSSRSAERG